MPIGALERRRSYEVMRQSLRFEQQHWRSQVVSAIVASRVWPSFQRKPPSSVSRVTSEHSSQIRSREQGQIWDIKPQAKPVKSLSAIPTSSNTPTSFATSSLEPTYNMLRSILFAAFAAVAPLSCASTVPADFVLARRCDDIDAVAGDDLILDAFIEANHPATSPNRTLAKHWDWDMYIFEEGEWQTMRSSLLQKAGLDESAIAARDLAVRQAVDEPHFNCKDRNTRPLAYAAKLTAAVYGICDVIVNGRTYYRYVFRRNVEDARPGAANAGALQATMTFLPKLAKWAAAGACGLALGVGNTGACILLEGTPQGTQQVKTGFTTSSEGEESSITFKDIPG